MSNLLNRSVIYLGPFSFPDGGAAARRILGNCKALMAAGASVCVASGQMKKNGEEFLIHEGVKVFSLEERNAEHLPKILKHLSYITMGKATIRWLNSLERKPDAIILYSGYSPYLIRLIPWARNNGVRLIFDAVEWYDPPSKLAALSPYYLNIEFAMRLLLPRVKHIVAISGYLDEHYRKKGCTTLIVPPLIDSLEFPIRPANRGKKDFTVLSYAGSPGNKDHLNDVIESVLQMRGEGINISINIAGVNFKDIFTYEAIQKRGLKKSPDGINCFGRLNHADSIRLVMESDFSVFLRRNARYANAGFPTKFVESLGVGTPVIANLTSDLKNYLDDGETGFVVADCSVEELKSSLTRAHFMPASSYGDMREKSRKAAERHFDFRRFSTGFANFIH